MRVLLISVIMLVSMSIPARAEHSADPAALITRLMASLESYDYEAYINSFHSMVKSDVLISPEAMIFWGNELAQVRENGFNGEFVFEPIIVTGVDLNFIYAFIVMNGVKTSEGLMLGLENNEWKVINII